MDAIGVLVYLLGALLVFGIAFLFFMLFKKIIDKKALERKQKKEATE